MITEIGQKVGKKLVRTALGCSLLSLTLGLGLNPAWAGDPFRTSNARPIHDQTELAFETLFVEGNYPQAIQALQQASVSDSQDPIIPAMQASLAYANQDWSQLNQYAQQTKSRAQSLVSSDQLRGNLYLGVATFLEGAYLYETKGTLAALGKVPTAMSYLDRAKQENDTDPEYNLIRGYVDLLLATNMPFANVDEAISRFDRYAAPSYLVNRGIAIAYRDQENLTQALSYANQAIASAPNHPELHYLKGQILFMQGNREPNDLNRKQSLYQQAMDHFDSAYQKRAQLPSKTADQLTKERAKVLRRYNELVAKGH